MKKFILLLAIVALSCQSLFAQTGGINFQGVARNSSGAVLANQKINLKFSILKTTETGAVEYTETKEATTNAQGIFAVVVGELNATSFAAVDWKASPKFLKVEMDAAGGTSFITMGTTRLQNVPYAYYANGVNANNIDGAVPVSKGGTGATDAATARTNLGLVIGTNVQSPLTAGTDYLTPTGNAATATKLAAAKKINGVDFDGSSDISIPTTADASTLSGTVSIAKGGTGATTAADARANLGLVIGTNVQAPLTAGTDYLTPTGNAATATLAGNITATSNSSLTTLPNLTTVGTISSGVWSGTTIAISKGGTGATNAAAALTNLGAESILNKSTDINQDASSTSKYPSVKLIKDYVDNRVFSGVSSSTDLIVSSINGLKLGKGAGNGYSNIAFGTESLFNNTSGGSNFAASYQSLYNNTIGNFNTSIGTQALFSNVNGSDNLALGYQALYRNTSGNSNIAIGGSALNNNTTGENNIANGLLSLHNNTIGNNNIALGYKSLFSNTTGYSNISNGYRALYNNDIGHSNIALGTESLFSNVTGAANFAASYQSLYYNTMGTNNISIGLQASFSNLDGNNNLALGYQALYRNTSGNSNIAIGFSAMFNNTTGENNIANGFSSLFSNSIGNNNIALGISSLYNNTTGGNNVAIGLEAGSSTTTGSNNIIIGYQASASTPTVSNTINLGNSSISILRAQVTSITSLSDKRDKSDIKNISEGLEFLKQLRPVSFTWNTRDKAKVGIKSAGFIAQELLELQKNSTIGENLDLVSQDNPEKLEARYNNLLPVIVKAIQEVNELKDKELAQLKAEKDNEIVELKERIQSLEDLIKKVLDAKKP